MIGGIWGKDRQGLDHFFPIMSLSLGVLVVRSEIITHHQHLACLATSAKKKAKHAGGNTFVVMDTIDVLSEQKQLEQKHTHQTQNPLIDATQPTNEYA